MASTPKVVQTNPEADAAKAAQNATIAANAQAALRNKTKQQSILSSQNNGTGSALSNAGKTNTGT